MFQENMIAPCGLNCSLCQDALRKENPCLGCLGDVTKKSKHCIENCKIFSCELRATTGENFCDTYPTFPCEPLQRLEQRYTTKYPVIESPLQNMQFIRAQGMDAFLEQEKEKWLCKECGSIICVHSGICSGCGRQYP